MARIVYEETGVGAVTITDRGKVLAFIGIGDDHHLAGTPITSLQTIEASVGGGVLASVYSRSSASHLCAPI
ncbi:hypothetical protein [Trinickia terrae]|uniref:hypothetical protein n=1 Tax=Trinickia terrae TaxID=2571161 RepID=UPI002106D95B|nr:hypothetical protein [Trinickia terrae]